MEVVDDLPNCELVTLPTTTESETGVSTPLHIEFKSLSATSNYGPTLHIDRIGGDRRRGKLTGAPLVVLLLLSGLSLIPWNILVFAYRYQLPVEAANITTTSASLINLTINETLVYESCTKQYELVLTSGATISVGAGVFGLTLIVSVIFVDVLKAYTRILFGAMCNICGFLLMAVYAIVYQECILPTNLSETTGYLCAIYISVICCNMGNGLYLGGLTNYLLETTSRMSILLEAQSLGSLLYVIVLTIAAVVIEDNRLETEDRLFFYAFGLAIITCMCLLACVQCHMKSLHSMLATQGSRHMGAETRRNIQRMLLPLGALVLSYTITMSVYPGILTTLDTSGRLHDDNIIYCLFMVGECIGRYATRLVRRCRPELVTLVLIPIRICLAIAVCLLTAFEVGHILADYSAIAALVYCLVGAHGLLSGMTHSICFVWLASSSSRGERRDIAALVANLAILIGILLGSMGVALPFMKWRMEQ